MSWKRMKGILGSLSCSRCGRRVHDSEFDEFEDCCVFCLFDGVGSSLPARMSYSSGVARNVTSERVLLDGLEYTPEVMSSQARASKESFERKNYGKKRKVYK